MLNSSMESRVDIPHSRLAPNPVLSNSLALDSIAGAGALFGNTMKCRLCDQPRVGFDDYPSLCLNHGRQSRTAAITRYMRSPKGMLRHIFYRQKSRSKKRGLAPPSYGVEDLLNLYLNDKRFLRLYKEWVESGWHFKKKPVVDRINFLKPYTLRNIHIVTWAENSYKGRMESRKWRSKPVACYENGNLVQSYPSSAEAARKTGLGYCSIWQCAYGITKTCGGLNWRFL